MEIIIKGWEWAVNYKPQKPTYAIRIVDLERSNGRREPFPPLTQDSNYIHVMEYVFDDVDPGYNPSPSRTRMFNQEIARQMLNDFQQGRKECLSLLVHCTHGSNRAPAVGIAFNDIFRLGEDTQGLMGRYGGYTRYIYSVLIKTARDLGMLQTNSRV